MSLTLCDCCAEVAVVALPGGSELPAAAYPAGSIILVQPLLGEVEVRGGPGCSATESDQHAGIQNPRLSKIVLLPAIC